MSRIIIPKHGPLCSFAQAVFTLLVVLQTHCQGQSEVTDKWDLWNRGRVVEARQLAAQAVLENAADNESRHLLVLTSFVTGQYRDGLRHYAQLNPEYERLKELDRLVLDVYQSIRRFDLAATFAKKSKQPDQIVTWMERLGERPLSVSLESTTVIPFATENVIRDLMPAVPISINGREYLGHLDTGGSYIAMSPKMAEELGIETSLIGKGRANAQLTDIEAGITDRLKIGDAVLENVPTVALSALQGALRSDGKIEDLVILGTNILEQFLTTWDNQEQHLVLSPRHDPSARKEHLAMHVPPRARVMEFYMVPDHYLIARGGIAGHQATFFVDTGLVILDANGRQPALMSSPKRLERFNLLDQNTRAMFVDVPGTVRLGSVQLSNQSVRLTSSANFNFAGIQPDALLAHGFLKHCVWTLDFDTRKWYLHGFRSPDETIAESASDLSSAEVNEVDTPPIAAALEKYVGTYVAETIGSKIVVTASGKRLEITASGNLRGEFGLREISDHTFEAERAPQKVEVKFEFNDQRAAQSASVVVAGQGPFVFRREPSTIE